MRILKSQMLNDEELLALAQSLSPINEVLHWDFGPIMEMRFDPGARNYLFSAEAVPLHWDGAFYREPRTLLFYCLDSEGEGGETLFAHTTKLWASLSPEMQERCRKVKLTYRTKQVAHYGGEITVPLVQAHPDTGATILRIAERVETALNPVELVINGVEDAEGLYRTLVAKLYEKEFLIEHRWERGDLILVDNYTYLHGRRPLGNNTARRFKRIQIL